jgi:hypothetical protein
VGTAMWQTSREWRGLKKRDRMMKDWKNQKEK